MKVLLKFSYDGSKFYGYQIQPKMKTVQGEILKILNKFGISDSVKSSSRTDRGVSALGNVIMIDTDIAPEKVIRILNYNLKDIYFYSYSIVDDKFNPRHATERWYKYYYYDIGYDLELTKKVCLLFEGTHDFSAYSKKDYRNSIRNIRKVKCSKKNGFYVIDIYGQSFLWNMVRRIVGTIQMVGLNKIDLKAVESSFKTGKIQSYTTAPENLILMDVKYNLKFNPVSFVNKDILKILEFYKIKSIFYSDLIRKFQIDLQKL